MSVLFPLGSARTSTSETASEVVADDVTALVARVLVVPHVLAVAKVACKHHQLLQSNIVRDLYRYSRGFQSQPGVLAPLGGVGYADTHIQGVSDSLPVSNTKIRNLVPAAFVAEWKYRWRCTADYTIAIHTVTIHSPCPWFTGLFNVQLDSTQNLRF